MDSKYFNFEHCIMVPKQSSTAASVPTLTTTTTAAVTTPATAAITAPTTSSAPTSDIRDMMLLNMMQMQQQQFAMMQAANSRFLMPHSGDLNSMLAPIPHTPVPPKVLSTPSSPMCQVRVSPDDFCDHYTLSDVIKGRLLALDCTLGNRTIEQVEWKEWEEVGFKTLSWNVVLNAHCAFLSDIKKGVWDSLSDGAGTAGI
ncbi:putative proline-rich protein [Moniliophthora roreri MCA 2997]|uniref:Proline-rich protein n=2 Tax=Moniliophthora roreri TaxID=221103 RepID=V2Y761_MONRO|nr:putative proline-rich protein [Moniliophthora roreri MCA 2997]